MLKYSPRIAVAAALLSLAVSAGPAVAQTSEVQDAASLRVCADPNDLPFSNEKGEGFENKVANILGAELGLPVTYTWFPQGPGFVKNTLALRRCDVVAGVAAGDDALGMTTTSPYYYSTYIMIARKDGPKVTGISDPKLKDLRIGVIANTPPVELMVKYKLMNKMRSYPLVIDTRFESSTEKLVKDVASGETDIGLVWGPIAGYHIKKNTLPLDVLPLKSEEGVSRLDFRIAMGVRGNEPEFRRKLSAALAKNKDKIDDVLRSYGVPLLNERGDPLPVKN